MVKTSLGKEKMALSCLKQATIVDAESQVEIAELLKLNINVFPSAGGCSWNSKWRGICGDLGLREGRFVISM